MLRTAAPTIQRLIAAARIQIEINAKANDEFRRQHRQILIWCYCLA